MASQNEQIESVNVNDMAKEYEEARQILQDSGASAAAIAVVDTEIKRIRCGNRPKTTYNNDGSELMDIYNDNRVRLVARANLPVEQFPKYNFLGKLLGPGGSTMKGLQEETMTRISILGRGSMRDRNKEEELRSSGDIKYAHLNEQLHIEVIAHASPAEAHARIAFALTELRKFITPEEENGMHGGDMQGPMMGGRGRGRGRGAPGPLMGMMGMGGPPRGRGRGGYGESTGRTMDFLEKARQSASEDDFSSDYGGGYDQFSGPPQGYDGGYDGGYGGGDQGWTASPRGGLRGAPRGAPRGSPAGRGAPRGRGSFGGDSSFGGGKAPPPSRGMGMGMARGRGRGAPY